MASSDTEMAVYECRSCDDRRLVAAERDCCGEPMEQIDTSVPIESPDIAHVMHHVFDISATELDVCRQVMAEDETTINELADEIDRDRSVITRHLNHLVELGIVEKTSRILADGGRVNVYSHCTEEELHRQLELGLYTWMLDALEGVEDVSEEKIAMMADSQQETETGLGQSVVDRVLGRDHSS